MYKNDAIIIRPFLDGEYWDEDTLIKLKQYIDPDKDILEIGGHCGTSTIVYASYLNTGKVYVYEPQGRMYNLLVKNLRDNNLLDKVVPFNKAVFCFNGYIHMTDTDPDYGGSVDQRYTSEHDEPCNFGGIGIGQGGEQVEAITIDSMGLDNVGFIHCDAQGAENYIFSKSLSLIDKCKPFILFEDNYRYEQYLYDVVHDSYPEYEDESKFDIVEYCVSKHGYKCIEKFNGSIDTLLYY